jgi:hypothetical protein
VSDPRLQQAADLILAVITDVATAQTNGAALHPEARFRLAMAHDAVTQADDLLADALTP